MRVPGLQYIVMLKTRTSMVMGPIAREKGKPKMSAMRSMDSHTNVDRIIIPAVVSIFDVFFGMV